MTVNGKEITTIFYDFDGVMTDNRVILSQDGIESVVVNRSDGYAVAQFKKAGIDQIIVSTESNPVVKQRADKLQIPVLSGTLDKGKTIKDYCARKRINLINTLFVGNDSNDIPAFDVVSIKVCPKDAQKEIYERADIIIPVNGGDGVIRELYRMLYSFHGT